MRLSALFILFLLLPFAVLSQEEPDKNFTKGVEIGNVIRGAVETAIPAIGPLMEAIWPKKNGGGNKKKAKEEDIQEALKNERAKWISSMKNELKPISSIEEEMKVVKSFLKPTSKLQIELVRINMLLNTNNPNWTNIKNTWDLADIQWGKFTGITSGDIGKVSNIMVRTYLSKVKDSSEDLKVIINQNISQENKESLIENCSDAIDLMRDITEITVFYIDDYIRGFESLTKFLNNPMGDVPASELTHDQKQILERLKNRYD